MIDDITIRPATPGDGETLWRWRNAPDVRRASLDSTDIPLPDHLEWYRRALRNPDREILIAEHAGQPMGMVRFDRADDTATVSILLDAAYRGKGLSGPVLSAAISASRSGGVRLRALVKHDNAASRALFLSLGFHVVSDGDTIVLEREGDKPE